jgi:hypothetical protein
MRRTSFNASSTIIDHTVVRGVTVRALMEPEWLSYAEVADRLGVTPEAARSRAKRLGWRRQMGNDGRALVFAALEPRPAGDEPATPRSPPGRKAVDPALLTALEGHVATLKAELEHRDAEIDTLKAELGPRNSELVAANARAGEESAKTAQAIAAFEGLAKRLEALAEAKRPAWRRWLGRTG